MADGDSRLVPTATSSKRKRCSGGGRGRTRADDDELSPAAIADNAVANSQVVQTNGLTIKKVKTESGIPTVVIATVPRMKSKSRSVNVAKIDVQRVGAIVQQPSPIYFKSERGQVVEDVSDLNYGVSEMNEDADEADDEFVHKSIKDEWKPAEHLILLDQIQAVMPLDDNIKYSTMADKLDWSKVIVEGHSATECKEQWMIISTKVRRFRTMSELLVDAKAWAKRPWNAFGKKTVKHPNMPKKPLTPYFRFFISKRERYAAKYPEMGVTDLTKKLSIKYSGMSEKKKQRYVETFNREMEDWRSAMDIFRANHPEAFDDTDKSCGGGLSVMKHSGIGGPPKTITAMQLYINEKCLEEQTNKTLMTRKQLYDHYRMIWSKLPDEQKLPFIDKAIEAKNVYDLDLEKYRAKYPDYPPRVIKTFLSKAEQKIKDKCDGKPQKPPGNGYSLFTVETLAHLGDLPNIERLGEVSRRWKKLSEDKREAYNLKADERNQTYRSQYEKYLQSLSPEARRRLEADDNDKLNSRKRPSCSFADSSLNGSNVAEKRTKPVAAVFIFIEDNKDQYKKTHPDMDDCEIQRQLVKDYNCLEEKDKAKYKQLEEQAKEKLARENFQASSIITQKKGKLVKFPGEPPLPPHSGYQLFSKELLLQLKDVKSNERLQVIGKRWALLSDADKLRHNKRKDVLWTVYRRDVEKFKKTLSPKDLKRYEDLHRPSKSKTRRKNKVEECSVVNESSSGEEEEERDKEGKDAINDDAIANSASSDNDDDGTSSSGESTQSSCSSSEGESECDADNESGYQLEKQRVFNGTSTQLSIKSGKLSAADVYDESSSGGSESSSEDSESESDTSGVTT